MSVTYIEDIPPIDEMPDWAQEAFHEASFFKACLERSKFLEKRISDLENYIHAREFPEPPRVKEVLQVQNGVTYQLRIDHIGRTSEGLSLLCSFGAPIPGGDDE